MEEGAGTAARRGKRRGSGCPAHAVTISAEDVGACAQYRRQPLVMLLREAARAFVDHVTYATERALAPYTFDAERAWVDAVRGLDTAQGVAACGPLLVAEAEVLDRAVFSSHEVGRLAEALQDFLGVARRGEEFSDGAVHAALPRDVSSPCSTTISTRRGWTTSARAGALVWGGSRAPGRDRHGERPVETGGTMMCQSMPKGLNLDHAVERLAVEVEDPIAYDRFVETILAGGCGGGSVMIWDRSNFLAEGVDGEVCDLTEVMLTFDHAEPGGDFGVPVFATRRMARTTSSTWSR